MNRNNSSNPNEGIEVQMRVPVARAATILGVSPYTVRKWIKERVLPHHRVGRRIVLDRRDLEAFLASHRVEARAEITPTMSGGDQ